MSKCIVTVPKLNKRNAVPSSLADKAGIVGIANKGFAFEGSEIANITNPSLGRWYKDRDNYFYWGGGLNVIEDIIPPSEPDNTAMDNGSVLPVVKRKIEQVINVFETGSAKGNYAAISKHADYTDPDTKTKIVQVTYGRSQTTEFGNLKALIQDYVNDKGEYASQLQPYLNRIGFKPSLATDAIFCQALINAGANDPIMKKSQDDFFDSKYYGPAYSWFLINGFALPLSLLVIYDSYIHSGSILAFLRKKFATSVPSHGGEEKEWLANYVNARYNWLANHSSDLLRKTVYRPQCFKDQIKNNNWGLSQPINAHGVIIS